jgi:DNA polymerase-3 subunit alpha
LDGASKIPELIARTKELGMDSIAITDHGVMYGVIDFYKEAKKQGIKPIIGCEVYVAPGSRHDREVDRGENRYYHLVLLAENDTGYHNLMKIVSRGFTEGFYYKPRVDREVLAEFHEGIIALSACLAGEVAVKINQGFYEEAKKAALEHQEIFGKGNYFLELQDHGMAEQANVNQGLMRMSKETGIELVATNDLHYVNAEDAEAHDILLCIQTGKRVNDTDRMRYEGGQYYLKSPQEMEELFPYAKEALENTCKIAERCNVDIVFGEQKLPKFEVPEGYTSTTYLRSLCQAGLAKRYNPVTDELKERLDYELSTIEKMGYVDYFLIVWDFIKYAKDHGIAVGPGRGSAAGAIVSYCLEITNIEPLHSSLLFERFLNPERVSMPDIDVDICYERRQEVIDYVVEKYGKEKVVQIVTFGTMAARMVIRDVGRVLDMPYAAADRIAKMIPQGQNVTIESALHDVADLKNAYESEPDVKILIDTSRKLEGLPRHTSVHAAGVVIGQRPMDEFVPLSRSSEGAITTQFTKDAVEELGLLKMDFLGLRTLTVIQDAVKNIKQSSGIDIDIDNIPIDDKKVYELLSTGQTDGICQIESKGMKSFMKELKPKTIDEVMAGISLYRPGPMDFIPNYLEGKENVDKITYDCPQLEGILSTTYGCIVYQEQVMQIVMELAGYTLGRSDLVRRAMSKKKESVMLKERSNFVYGNPEEGVPGCINRGIDEKTANKIFDDMVDFAKYAFNKSHAAAYAVVTYQTAYLKCHYPKEFMAALLTSILDRTDKVSAYVAHCRKIGIEVLPPDINEGFSYFSVSSGGIRYGLSALKSVGRPVIDAIVAERTANGPFKDLKDFVSRLSNKEVNKRTVESFIKAGAFDSFPSNRRQMMMIYNGVIDQVNQEKKNNMSGQMSLMDLLGEEEKKDFDIKYPDVVEYDKEELLAYEKEMLGVYVSGHPLDDYADFIGKNTDATTIDFIPDPDNGATVAQDEHFYTLGGMIASKNVKLTKTNQNMAFITLEDIVGSIEIVVFPKTYEKYRQYIEEDAKILVYGRASISETEGKLILEKLVPFDEVPRNVYIQVENKAAYEESKNRLYDIIDCHSGSDNVIVMLKEEKLMKPLGNQFRMKYDEYSEKELKQQFGEGKVVIKEGKVRW